MFVFYYQAVRQLPWSMLIGLLISVVCPTGAPAEPFWVLRRPKEDGFFVGIGVARRAESLPESRDCALKRALKDIAAQIETSVSGETYMKETEKAGEIRQEYRVEVMTMVSATLEGVEIVDTWEDDENCWAYARLSEAKLERLRQKRIESARRAAFTLFSKADELAVDAPAEALALYVQALEPLRDSLGDPLLVTHRGKAIAMDTEIPSRIQAILSSIELQASPVETSLKHGTAVDVPLEIEAFVDDRGTKHAMNGVPIRFSFEKGRGDLDVRVWTGEDGSARSRLRVIHDPASVQVIRAEIDLASLSVRDTLDSALHQQLVRFAVPRAVFELDILQQMVLVVSSESNLGLSLELPYIRTIVKEQLTAAGLGLVDRRSQADLVIEIDARTRQGNRFHDIYFSLLDMTFSVRSRRRDELFSTSLIDVKGSGISYEQAGIAAFKKVGEPLRKTVLSSMLHELNR